ncbi:MAG: epoxyqueuosine reductase [Methanomassiliicoccales archaeon]|jgi:epoxyqueuosine reductase QueG
MNEKLKDDLVRRMESMDIPLYGIADPSAWDSPPFEPWMPSDFYPRSIYPECRSVIVIGLPISLPVIETTPSIHYHEMYKTVNTLLDQSAYRLSVHLSEKGHGSFYIPRDGYGSISVLKDRPIAFFSHRHAAYFAGLGNFGMNNALLTKKYGPRVRFTSIFTTAELPYDSPLDSQLCTRCFRCIKKCPVQALPGKDYPEALLDKERCRMYNEKLFNRHVHPCGVCIKVCPVGEDRKLFDRTDMSIYEEEGQRKDLRNAWKHVQSYGGKR